MTSFFAIGCVFISVEQWMRVRKKDRPAEIIAQSTGENNGEHVTAAVNNDRLSIRKTKACYKINC